MKNLEAIFLTTGFLFVLSTAQSAYAQQPITPANLGQPGTTLLTKFDNGTSKIMWVNGTAIQFLDGVGVLVLGPSVSSALATAASSPSTFISNTNTINRIYQAIAIAIGISINNTIPQPPQQPPTNDTQGPDERCLFDPSLPHCAAVEGECPDGFFMNKDDQCVPTHTRCPEGYHSHEDDESGRCIPDSTPCQEGYIMNPRFPSCDIKEFVCQEFPELEECRVEEQPEIEPTPEPEPTSEPEPDGNGGNDGSDENDGEDGSDE